MTSCPRRARPGPSPRAVLAVLAPFGPLAVLPVLAPAARVAGLAVLLAACGHDQADRESLAALAGDEEGMTREQQIAHLDRAIALKPDRAHYYEQRGGYRVDGGDFPAALADLDRAIALADRPYLRYFRGLVLCQSGRIADALPDFDLAIAGQPENSQFYRGRGLALAALGRPAEALADADRLVVLAGQWAPSHYTRGMALQGLGRHQEALAELDQARAQMPELSYVPAALATSLEALGEPEAARAARAEALRLGQQQSGCGYCHDPFRY